MGRGEQLSLTLPLPDRYLTASPRSTLTRPSMTERPQAEPGVTASGGPQSRTARRSAMSERDMAILRSLANRIDPEDAGAHNNLGVVFFQKGLIQDAVAAFERALELDPRLDVARRNAEVAFRESGQLEARVRELSAAVRTDPANAEAREALARTYLLGGDADGAAREWRKLLHDRPDSTTLHMKLAHAEAVAGRVKEALWLLESAAELSPDLPAVRLQLAELLLDSGMPVRAERETRRALALDDSLPRAYAVLGRLLERTGREKEAAEALDRARELDPDAVTSEAHLSLERYRAARSARSGWADGVGEVELDAGPAAADDAGFASLARAVDLRRAGDLEGAAMELERLVDAERARGAEASDGGSHEARQSLAEIRLLRGQLQEAADAYEALIAERQDSPKLWNERGVAVHRMGRFKEAVRAYRRTVALDHTYVLGWNNLAVALAQNGETGAAERAFRKAAAGEAPPELLWNLGLFLSLTERQEEAVEVYRAAVDADRSVAESWSRLGSALFQSRHTEAARGALLEALERDPELAEARYQLGFALSALGDFKGALREIQRALEQVSVLPTPRYQLLVDVQFEGGSLPAPEAGEGERIRAGTPVPDFDFDPTSLDAAFAHLHERAASPSSTRPNQSLEAARTALRRGQLRRAAEAVGRAVAEAPGAAEPRLLEGEVLLKQGLSGEALERFDAVLAGAEVEHDMVREASVGRARALLDLGRTDQAVAAAADAGRAGGPASLLGRALLAAGRPVEAVDVYRRAVADGEEDAATLSGLGGALLEAGRPEDARRAFSRSIETGASAAARLGLGRALEALGDREGSVSSYREAAAALPSYAPAQMALAEVEWRAGDGQEAIRTLVDFLALDPMHVEGLVRLGTWLGEMSRPDQGTRLLRRALTLEPDHELARRELDRLTSDGR